MPKTAKRSTKPVTPAKADNIRCAMTGDKYEEISQHLSEIEGLLELVWAPDGVDYLGLQVGLHIIRKKVKSAQDLMQAAWDRTREAREAA